VKLYPNRATDYITVVTGQPRGTVAEVVFYNAMGQPVLRTEAGQSRIPVGVSSLPAGLYLVEVKGEHGTLRGKCIKH